jgi:hypothetical protein
VVAGFGALLRLAEPRAGELGIAGARSGKPLKRFGNCFWWMAVPLLKQGVNGRGEEKAALKRAHSKRWREIDEASAVCVC